MKTVLKWIFGIGCILLGLLSLTISMISSVLFLISGAFLIPPVFDKINSSGKINRTFKIIVPIVAVFIAIIVGGNANSNEVETAMEKIKERQKSLSLEKQPKNKENIAELTQNSSEILFQVKTNDKDDLEIFEDGIIPWISIKNPESEINNLIGKDEIVIDNGNVTLIIDYPLNNPVEVKIKSDNSNGFTRKELAQKISTEYNRIYKEEEESAKTKTTPIDERQGLINRNQTDGKYGIWGHDIDDLDLSAIILREAVNGEMKLELIIQS